ncbi:MAG: right-handed parallel beta-helix repeat-containing protein [Candidatus Moranbacteria bacterium]|nr:right-handed parallel beta-helix repeat-containing protein [Candidatus Moranbacteria bacterium]
MPIKIKIILFFLLFFGGFFFASVSFSRAEGPTTVPDGTHVKEATTWKKSESPYLIQGSVAFDSGSSLTIEPGVVVKFKYQEGSLDIFGGFSAVGTEKDRIVFTSERDDSSGGDTNGDGNATEPGKGDWPALSIGGPWSSAKIKYASVLYGGGGAWPSASFIINNRGDTTIERTEVKYSKCYGLKIIGEPLEKIEENVIAHNGYCGIYYSGSGRTITIRNNSIYGNACGARVYLREDVVAPPTDRIDARYNWWGDDSGPEYNSSFGWTDNPGGQGNKVLDGVIIDPWLEKDPNDGPDPVIIIPGIMGSWENYDGEWKIDPIFHTYDNLRDEFLANDYEAGVNYFEFPYEWRNSNVGNAIILAEKIEDIKDTTGRSKVDIVAHSMGGLLAREYIESDYYADDVDQLITIGTPQLGAPKDYIKWEAGEFFGDIYERVGRSIFYLEALENNYRGIFPYIREKIPSVKELLPIYSYLYDEIGDNFVLRDNYPDNYPQNEFLENLNSSEKVKLLGRVDFTKIIGKKDDDSSTISGYNVVEYDIDGIWDNGYPKYFEIPVLNRQGILKDVGDETVPVYSSEAENVPANKTTYFSSDHNSLPTEAQQDILEILTGERPNGKIDKWHTPNLLLLMAHSPIDIQIESPDPGNQKIGKNFETGELYDEIKGAYYTGFKTNSEFITIPNPENGEYKITVQGTGDGGHYAIEAVKMTYDPDDPENAIESAVTIEGKIQPEEIKENEVAVDEEEISYDDNPPEISISSPEEIDYTNDKILEIDYSATDNESGIASSSWKVEKDGENVNWEGESIDLSLVHLGDYIFTVEASDNAGNSKTESRNFRIKTDIGSIRNNIFHYDSLGFFKKKAVLRYLSARIRAIKNLLDALEKTESSKLKQKPKEMAQKVLEKTINFKIDQTIKQINRKTPKWIDPQTAEFFVEDFNSIKINN